MYLCSSKHNSKRTTVCLVGVVNCFKMCIFAVASTITHRLTSTKHCCELLQNVYLCSSKHNETFAHVSALFVVNCFKMCIFAVASTIAEGRFLLLNFVVNCFKMCIFAVASTIRLQEAKEQVSCELLQNVYLCSSKHNVPTVLWPATAVVNCFKMCIFAVASTIPLQEDEYGHPL